MYKLIRPLLFKLSKDPETVHNLALSFLKLGGLSPFRQITSAFTEVNQQILKQRVLGLEFKNPVGLAAGFDKEAVVVQGLEALGFGFLELGTVTPLAQSGNTRPRLFRLDEDMALINRMGFNNHGIAEMKKNLETLSHNSILGISLGKNKITSIEKSVEDYLSCFKELYNYGDYFVVNISSPNTPGLRQLQDKKYLLDIFTALNNFRKEQKHYKPILIKVVIDFSLDAIDEILQISQDCRVDGIIASNTSLSREGLKNNIQETGGLSGKPIKKQATTLIRYIHKHQPNLPIIGVGGIFTAEDAYEKIKAGASLIQVYTGLIYEGPLIAKKINTGLVKLLKRDGFKNISEAVGVEAR